jgi:hypothetical protein
MDTATRAESGTTLSRRRVLRGGAVAATAGFVWSTPVVRSFAISGAAGSPPPTSTVSTPPTTYYELDGSFEGPFTRVPPPDECDARFSAAVNFAALGAATIGVSFDLVTPTTVQSCADFSIETANGTLAGALHGTANGTFAGPFTIQFTGVVTSGTGQFAGATGTLEISGSGKKPSRRTERLSLHTFGACKRSGRFARVAADNGTRCSFLLHSLSVSPPSRTRRVRPSFGLDVVSHDRGGQHEDRSNRKDAATRGTARSTRARAQRL